MQLSLVPVPEIKTLVDDKTGQILYKAALFDDDTASRWFEELKSHVIWRSEHRPMYDRIVAVPRLVASYDLKDGEQPESIRSMRAAVELFCGVVFTSVGLNYYRDGRDSVAPHGDHLETALDRAPVALVSLGATRRMTIRGKVKPRRVLDLDLEQGSLLVMSYASHLNYDHGIPKTRYPVGQRISVAFRRTSS